MAVVRFIMIAIGLALLAAAVAAIAAAPWLGGMVRKELQTRLGAIVGAEAGIGGIGIDPRRAAVVLRDITVGNPEPFDQDGPAIRCPEARVELDPVALFSAPLRVRRVHLDRVDVTLHWIPGKGTNLGALLERARAAGETPADTRFPPVILEEIACGGGTVSPRNKLLAALPLDLDIAPFTVRGLDKDGPIRPGKVVGIALRSLVREVLTLKGLLAPVTDLLRREAHEGAELVGIDPPGPLGYHAPHGGTPPRAIRAAVPGGGDHPWPESNCAA